MDLSVNKGKSAGTGSGRSGVTTRDELPGSSVFSLRRRSGGGRGGSASRARDRVVQARGNLCLRPAGEGSALGTGEGLGLGLEGGSGGEEGEGDRGEGEGMEGRSGWEEERRGFGEGEETREAMEKAREGRGKRRRAVLGFHAIEEDEVRSMLF